MSVFNDAWLDDQKALAGGDSILRRLAEAGARVRREAADSAEPKALLQGLPRPRAVIAAGTEARFIRGCWNRCVQSRLWHGRPIAFLAGLAPSTSLWSWRARVRRRA